MNDPSLDGGEMYVFYSHACNLSSTFYTSRSDIFYCNNHLQFHVQDPATL